MTALAFAAMLFLLAARYYPERDIPVKSSDGDAARADEDTASSDALLQAMRTTRTPPPDNGTSNVKPPPQENTTPEPDFAGGLRPARQMLLLGKAEDALQQFRELKQRYPDPADQMTLNAEIAKILFEQARSLEGQNRPTEAIALLTEITTSYRNSGWSAQARQSSANILLNQATFQKNQDKLKEATSILDKIIEEFPDTQAGQKAVRERPRLLTRRATRLLSTDPEATVELLRTASAAATEDDAPNINKQFFAALIYRAEWHLRHKRLDECAKDVREFKARNPENTVALKELEPKLLFNRAKALLGEKDYEGALILWKRLRQEYRGSPWIRRGMKEMVGLEKLARSGASNAAIFFKIAEDKRADGKLEDARADYESLAKIFPDSDEARKAEALLSGWDMTEAMDHWRGGRMKQGAAILKQIAKEYPASPLAKQASSELARLAAAPEEMIYVPGGEFIMGLDDTTALKIADLPPSLFEREIGPQILGQKVAVKPFYIDRHEVTNAQYKLFMDDTGAAVPPCPAWVAEAKQIRKGYENYPVTSVAWNEAAAYAKWAKKRLPTEAEWEKAARGIDGRLFPWGNTFAAEKAIVGSASPRPKHPAPVGSAPEGRSPYGAQDMIGNVREWTQDIYKPYAPKDAVSVLLEERNRVVRGAGWHERDTFASLCTSRWPTPPNAKEITLGFRCASSAK
jgi:formylglycine-generating enzyme required for sulfatase activity